MTDAKSSDRTAASQEAAPHGGASPWVMRFMNLVPDKGLVLDLAAGRGRHAKLLSQAGYRIIAADRDKEVLAVLSGTKGVSPLVVDFEALDGKGSDGSTAPFWPFAKGRLDGIVVTNYLYRPLLPWLIPALRPGGILIYETFGQGNGRFGRPSTPAFLLRPGELPRALGDDAQMIAYEHGLIHRPAGSGREDKTPQKTGNLAVIQRICAARRKNP